MRFLHKIAFLLFLITNTFVFGQTPGFNYQALILNNEEIQIPGTNVSENKVPLGLEDIALRFTITNEAGIEYIEEHLINTDENGMVSVIVGEGIPIKDTFNNIYWDGKLKYLNVELNILNNTDGFVFLDSQKILYIPQPESRNGNIKALNGLYMNDNSMKLGGILIEPTTITTNKTNTLAFTGLQESTNTEDKIVVIDKSTGILRQKSTSTILQKTQVIINAREGQLEFTTPLNITSIHKIEVYRNGVNINFTAINNSTIKLELDAKCYQDDKIKIIQLY
ncbi:hypothetical protein [Polaribacter atrinae]|uniref:hypothetical protein n=1 Tax=Polaribacter atrinae TaxID=1333662 RepID=UPI0030FB3449